MRTSNVRAMLADPLSREELARRDRLAPLRLASSTLVPAEMQLRKWLLRVRGPLDPPYDVQCDGTGPPTLCRVRGCALGACPVHLRTSTVGICAEHLRGCRIGAPGVALSEGFCACCLEAVDGLEAWVLSSGHRVCGGCAKKQDCALSTHLEGPVSSCLSCSRALQRPYRFGLDGQLRCRECDKSLPSGGDLLEDMAARLVLVWLNLCHL